MFAKNKQYPDILIQYACDRDKSVFFLITYIYRLQFTESIQYLCGAMLGKLVNSGVNP